MMMMMMMMMTITIKQVLLAKMKRPVVRSSFLPSSAGPVPTAMPCMPAEILSGRELSDEVYNKFKKEKKTESCESCWQHGKAWQHASSKPEATSSQLYSAEG